MQTDNACAVRQVPANAPGLVQRGADGYPVGADALMRQAWGPIPAATEFQHHDGSGYKVPLQVHGWSWSTTFGSWSAQVTFQDGWKGYTWPKPAIA